MVARLTGTHRIEQADGLDDGAGFAQGRARELEPLDEAVLHQSPVVGVEQRLLVGEGGDEAARIGMWRLGRRSGEPGETVEQRV